MSRLRMRRVGVVLALSFAVAATVATQGPAPTDFPTSSGSARFAVELSRQAPLVARRIHISVQHGGHSPTGVTLVVTSEDDESSDSPWVSLIPMDPAEAIGVWGRHLNVHAEADLLEYCSSDCERSYVIVARQSAAAVEVSTNIRVDLRSFYEGQGEAPAGALASLTVDDEPAEMRGAASVRLVASGAVEVSDVRPLDLWQGQLLVPRQLFEGYGDLGYPLVGKLLVRGATSESGYAPTATLEIHVGFLEPRFAGPSTASIEDRIEIDWLDSCQSESDCVVPVSISMRFEPIPDESGRILHGSLRYDFDVDFALDYLDRIDPPADIGLEFIEE